MFRMNINIDENPSPRRGYRAGAIMIALTAAACLAALLFRTPIRSRYWAWQVIEARGVAERAAPLTCLCNAGDASRWGTEVLLTHPDGEIRQFGVLVLQHVRTDRSRRRLLQMLKDPNAGVREMAALGLALHGDESIIPELKRLYIEGDAASASAACLALERLATPNAVVVLRALANEPANVTHRAALVDALTTIGTVDCAAALLNLLCDCRPCDVPTRDERLLAQLAPLAAESGLVGMPTSQPASVPAVRTIAERAAAALARITGLNPPLTCDLSEKQREDAARVWRDWITAQRETP